MQENINNGSTPEEFSSKNLLSKIDQQILDFDLFKKSDKLLLAVSGGRDSMFLLHSLGQLGYNISVAHCNFQLRGKHSDEEQKLVRSYCNEHNIPFYTKNFNVPKMLETEGGNTQIITRHLRYLWFVELLESKQLKYIITAHHQDDDIESFFINLIRGSGIAGLSSIPMINKQIRRPMLHISRSEITTYCHLNSVPYLDDQTNFKTDYLRNKIRLDFIPYLKKIHPNFLDGLRQSVRYLKDDALLLQHFIQMEKKELQGIQHSLLQIPKAKCRGSLGRTFLFHLLKPYGFNSSQIMDMQQSIDHVGAKVFSRAFAVYIDREYIHLLKTEYESNPLQQVDKLESGDWISHTFNLKLTLTKTNQHFDQISLDKSKINFPIFVRSWEEGDHFYPKGMHGKRQKLKKFFTNQKIPLFLKKQIPLLVDSENQIIAIIGYRQDSRFYGKDYIIYCEQKTRS